MKSSLKFLLLLFFVAISMCSSFISVSVKKKHKTQITHESTFNILVVNKDDMKFGVSNKRPVNSDFYTNSNFFTSTSSIGLVVINGKKINSRSSGGGYFYVVNGRGYVRAKRCPKNVDFASQSILWAIDNGVKNNKLFTTRHGKLKRYRTIIGEDKNGNIIIISSNRLGLVTIKEIVDFAKNKGMIEGILLDGGTSIDYKFSDDTSSLSFESVPINLKPFFKIKKPTTYIYGNFN